MHHDACVLTHSLGGDRQDLVIIKQFDRPYNFVMGLPLFAGQSYPNRVQLSVVAQADIAHSIGRLTYMAVRGRNSTVLIAPWPAEQLLTVMRNAKQLGFYDPERHLVRLVNLGGIAEASAQLRNCARGNNSVMPMSDDETPTVDPQPSNGFPSNIYGQDRGWVNETDHGNCHLSRRTAQDNEVSLTMTRGSPDVLLQLFIHDGHSAQSGAVLPVTFTLSDLGESIDFAAISLSNAQRPKPDVMSLHMRAINGTYGLSLFAVIDSRYLQKFRNPVLNQLTIDLGSGWRDTLNTLRTQDALTGFNPCADTTKYPVHR